MTSGEVAAVEDGAGGTTRVHEWGLNPMFWSYVKLFARDVHGLGTLEGIDDSHVLHGNKAVHRVEVSGMVVHIKPGTTKTFGSYVKYIIDDGTGLLPCTQYERNAGSGVVHHGHAQRHELGELLVVQGKLKRFRGAREVVITSACKPADPNEETLHWLRCIELQKTVYRPPFQRDDYIDEDLVRRSSQARPTQCDCGAAYEEAVGYCRCVAAAVDLDPAFEFRDAMLSHLAAKEKSLSNPAEPLRFQFARDVRDEPALKETAARVVSSPAAARSGGRGGGSGSGRVGVSTEQHASPADAVAPAQGPAVMGKVKQQARVMELLRAVMSSLHRDGALHFSDKAADVYLLVSRGRVLQPAVEEACRQRRLGLNQENEIIRALQGSALFHHVPGPRIRACVHRMKKMRSALLLQQRNDEDQGSS
ncbi:unnamed protein product [Scytosiphon promiscuus]